ncbi:DUF5316 family protein [Paenibacillus lupini]|uniref:DUF5316 family protein n=1 Tax=Paenibacillus TaxID=44249 RepID=UPI00141E6102|nr:DUF5316 family protein [Paenibacillus lupini]NIK21743.1 hypothetical protein [Paenibacillus lupini]
MMWFIYIGCAFIFISGLMVGAWTTADQQRANFNTEVPSERKIKRKIATISAGLGVICFAIAAAIYLL